MDADILKELLEEFITETGESLIKLEQDLMSYENNTNDAETLNRIFRVIHTVKGSGGSLALSKTESIAHEGEQLLHLIREEHRDVDNTTVSLILEVVDALNEVLVNLQKESEEGDVDFSELCGRIRTHYESLSNGPVEEKATVSEPAELEEDKAVFGDGEDSEEVEIIPPGEGQSWGLFDDSDEPTCAESKSKDVEADKKESKPKQADTQVSVSKKPNGSSPTSNKAEVSESSIRVEIKQLDNLMALVGELVLTRNQLVQKAVSVKDQNLDQSVLHLDHITSELQQEMMKTRMQPIGNAWTKLPRIVRDLARSMGKNIRLELEGRDTELDRSLIEAIKDPLLHLVRNSIDHGLETPEERKAAGKDEQGLLYISAYHESGQVNIDITDDGRGIDLNKVRTKALENEILSEPEIERLSDREVLNLIFQPGFSTAEQVSNVSGRGVGMDVVRSNIERIGGSVEIQSDLTIGTSLKLKIPLTLAIIPALIVRSAGERFAISQMSLQELVRLEGDEIREKVEDLYDTKVYRLRGNIIPIVFLSEVLKIGDSIDVMDSEAINIVVLQSEGKLFGLVVDEIYDSEEIVVKPLSSQLGRLTCFSGATIMGDGQVALILDAQGLGHYSNAFDHRHEDRIHEDADDTAVLHSDMKSMLIFNACEDSRMAVPLIDVNRIEDVPIGKIESIRGELKVQHRGQILKLIHLSKYIPGVTPLTTEGVGILSVIVFSDQKRSVGLIVKDVLDIVNETVEIQEPSIVDFIEGSMTLGGKVTELLNADRILDLSDPLLIEEKLQNEA